jgi:hypothetical protein
VLRGCLGLPACTLTRVTPPLSHTCAHVRPFVRSTVAFQQFRTAAEMEQYAKDLAAFGTNRLEISHVDSSWNASNMGVFSDICAGAGQTASIWVPASDLALNYTVTREVRRGERGRGWGGCGAAPHGRRRVTSR